MYIQVTNRCNMTCAHCCMSCTKEGQDMPLQMFKTCVNVANSFGESISIGGGEPTLHPKIIEMLAYAIANCDEIQPWISTNGTNKNVCEFMMKLAKGGLLGLQFSIDEFHDTGMIDEYLFKRIISDGVDHRDEYARGNHKTFWTVRRDSIRIANQGRAKELTDYETEDYCSCPDLEIKPNGNVHWCGCENSPSIGNYKDLQRIVKIYGESRGDFDCWFKMNDLERLNMIRRLKY